MNVAILAFVISLVCAVPLQKKSSRKPDCPLHTLQHVDETIALLPLRTGRVSLDVSSNVAQDAASGIASLLDTSRTCRVTIPVQFVCHLTDSRCTTGSMCLFQNNYYVVGSTSREDGYITDEQFATALTRLNTDYATFTSIQFSLLRINRMAITADAWAGMEVTSDDSNLHEQIGEQIKGSNPAQNVTQTLHVNIVQDADACGLTYLPS